MLHSKGVSRGSLQPNVVRLMAACIRTRQPSTGTFFPRQQPSFLILIARFASLIA
jgi:hypothetical protein